jgi:hypothetical protein
MMMMIIIIMCMLQGFLQRSAAASDVGAGCNSGTSACELRSGLLCKLLQGPDREETWRSAEGIAFVDVIIVIVIIP